jgi:hypothetical protein
VHALEDAVEVLALQRQQLVERLSPIGFVVGEDHALHDRDPPLAEEMCSVRHNPMPRAPNA